jgi:uncharacterized membrane protein HdeD (DUF308 family)
MATISKSTGNDGVLPRTALTPAQNPDRLAEHVAGVRTDVEKRGYDAAVLGHTHKPGRIGDWYFNSGSWTGALNTYLRIASDGGVRHLEWKDGRAIEHQMPVVLSDSKAKGAQSPFETAVSAVKTFFPRPQKPERSRWILIAQGALALLLGFGAMWVTVEGAGWRSGFRLLVSAFGAYALVDGALSLYGSSREQPVKRLLYRVRGAASLLLGLVVLRRGYSMEIFVILVGVWAFIAGALRIAASLVFRHLVDSKWLLLVGITSMWAGLTMLLWPASPAL